jgi:dTDP-4-dehydrorhamnose 3,5-epimerase
MKVIPTELPEVLLIEPKVYGDPRGFFYESYNARVFEQAGIPARFVQDNHSRSQRHVLRGLHYQIHQPQGKLIRVSAGAVFDVAVDLRRQSRNYGKWVGFTLSEENRRIAWIPPGFGHGFLVQSDSADFQYKTTDYYAPEHERCIRWDDTTLAIRWPLTSTPILSPKDQAGKRLDEAEVFP